MTDRPSFSDLFTNWRSSDLPFAKKLAAALRNNAIKARRGSSCCGNHGEPGC